MVRKLLFRDPCIIVVTLICDFSVFCPSQCLHCLHSYGRSSVEEHAGKTKNKCFQTKIPFVISFHFQANQNTMHKKNK